MSDKPHRVLCIQMSIHDGQIAVSAFPYPSETVCGKYGSKTGWVNYYKFGARLYDITIISMYPGAEFDRETALKYATDYAAGRLKVIRTNIETLLKTAGRLDIHSENFIPDESPPNQ